MHHVYLRFPGGKDKCLTLSYDDCVEQDIRLCELMKQYGIAGTFNINTGIYTEEGHVFPPDRIHRRMTKARTTECFANEPLLEVATHGATHPYLHRIPAADATWDVLTDRRNIEEQFGTICRGHAYPFGTYNDQVIGCLRACGIVYARTVKSTEKFAFPEDFLQWHPTCHHDNPRLMELADKFLAETTAPKPPKLFYLWGHSFEFDENDNWQVIEEFFRKIAGREDIWYATNIQVYEYKTAFDQLIWNADCTKVYNPTATKLWFQAKKQDFSIEPGQTLTL